MRVYWSRGSRAVGLMAVGLLLGLTACGGPSGLRSEPAADGASRARQAADPHHPADTDGNGTLSISEVTAYGAAWKSGATWPTEPNPIPIDYVTNAGAIWKAGEAYRYDAAASPPFVAGAGSASAPTNDLTVSATAGAVRGTVGVEASSRAPGGRPAVFIPVGGNHFYQTAETDGRFGFGNLSGGDYAVTAALPGYQNAESNVTVQPASVAEAGHLLLRPDANPITGGIAGQVLDGTNQPVRGALVRIAASNNMQFTGADGSYNFPTVPAGRWTVIAGLEGVGNAQVEVQVERGQQATANLLLQAAAQPPTVNAMATAGATIGTFEFDGQVVLNAAGATVATYTWDFESDGTVDHTSATTAQTTHAYTVGGTFAALLRVTDSGGRVGEDTVMVVVPATVNAPPTVTASVATTGTSGTYAFSAEVVVNAPGASLTGYAWDFENDGTVDYTSATTAQTSHAYATGGSYTAVLRVTDSGGRVGQDTVTVVVSDDVNAPPAVTATASPGTADVGRTISFDGTALAKAPGASVERYEWDFDGDGTVDATSTSTPRATYTYSARGTYAAELRATDSGGRVGRDTVTVEVTSGDLGIIIE